MRNFLQVSNKIKYNCSFASLTHNSRIKIKINESGLNAILYWYFLINNKTEIANKVRSTFYE